MGIKYRSLPSWLLLLAVVIGCKSTTTGPESLAPMLFGQVTDEQGSPIQGAGIHYIFSVGSQSRQSGLYKTCPSTTIQFIIPHQGHVLIRILRWYTREFVATLIDTTL
jgi:hypothetical protein